jgi:hypothetical protein
MGGSSVPGVKCSITEEHRFLIGETITTAAEVQVWEAVPSDSLGRVAANL